MTICIFLKWYNYSLEIQSITWLCLEDNDLYKLVNCIRKTLKNIVVIRRRITKKIIYNHIEVQLLLNEHKLSQPFKWNYPPRTETATTSINNSTNMLMYVFIFSSPKECKSEQTNRSLSLSVVILSYFNLLAVAGHHLS